MGHFNVLLAPCYAHIQKVVPLLTWEVKNSDLKSDVNLFGWLQFGWDLIFRGLVLSIAVRSCILIVPKEVSINISVLFVAFENKQKT